MGWGAMGGAAAQAGLNTYLQLRGSFRADDESKAKLKAAEYDLASKQNVDNGGQQSTTPTTKEEPGFIDTVKGWFSSTETSHGSNSGYAPGQNALPAPQPAQPVQGTPSALPAAPQAQVSAPTPRVQTGLPQEPTSTHAQTEQRTALPKSDPSTWGTADAPSAKWKARALQMMDATGPGAAKIREEGEKLYARAQSAELQERIGLVQAGKAAVAVGDWQTAAGIATRNIPNGVKYEYVGMSDDGKLPVFNIQHGEQAPQRVPVHPANIMGMLDEMAKDPNKYFAQTMDQNTLEQTKVRDGETSRHNLQSEKIQREQHDLTVAQHNDRMGIERQKLGLDSAKLSWDQRIQTARLKMDQQAAAGAPKGADLTTTLNKVLTAAGGDPARADGAVQLMQDNGQFGGNHLKALAAQDDIAEGIKKGTYKPEVGITTQVVTAPDGTQVPQRKLNLSVTTKKFGTVSLGEAPDFDTYVGRFSNDEKADPAAIRNLATSAAAKITEGFDSGTKSNFGKLTTQITPQELQTQAKRIIQQSNGAVTQEQAIEQTKLAMGEALDRLYFSQVQGGKGLGKHYVQLALDNNVKQSAKSEDDAKRQRLKKSMGGAIPQPMYGFPTD